MSRDLRDDLMERTAIANGPPTIEWRDYYSVGSHELDGQHQKIISMVNWLYEVIWEGHEREALPTLMRRLSDYTHSHFEDEERMMRNVAYPAYREHKEIHDKLSADTSDLLFGSLQYHGTDARDVLRFLKQWWINHITGDDKLYMFYLHENAQSRLTSRLSREMCELLNALVENERQLRHYYETMGSFLPEYGATWESLQYQEESHAAVLERIRVMVEAAPNRFAVGRFSPNAARMMTREVNDMIERIEAGEVRPRYAIHFAIDLEQSLLEGQLAQAIRTDVIEVQNLLVGLSDETGTHRDLLQSIEV